MSFIKVIYWDDKMQGADGHWHSQDAQPDTDKVQVVLPDFSRTDLQFAGRDVNCTPYYEPISGTGRRLYFHGEAQLVDQP